MGALGCERASMFIDREKKMLRRGREILERETEAPSSFHPGIVMRVGEGEPPTAVSSRLPVSEFIVQSGAYS